MAPQNLPTYQHPSRQAVQADLDLCADLLGGTRAMWARSATYIRKWGDEAPAVYEMRRQCETLFGGFQRTLGASVGLLFATPPALTWNQSESAMAEVWANVDAMGAAGPVLAKRFAEHALRDGFALLLTDHTRRPEGVVVTAANERALNLRPVVALYTRAALLSWRTQVVNNVTTVTQVTLQESAEVEDGDFGVKVVKRYRVLRITGGVAEWLLFEALKDKPEKAEDFRLHSAGVFRDRAGHTRDTLPIAVAYTGATEKPFECAMPLLPVAFANLAHWQIATDLRFNRHVAGYEQAVVTGTLAQETPAGGVPVPGKVRLGPLVAVHLEQGGSFEWKSPSGAGLAQLAEAKDEKLHEIAKQGLSFLVSDTRAAETAESKRLDSAAENATLATAAQGIEDALNTTLEHLAWYLGIEKADAPVLTLSRDYESTAMAADVMNAFAAFVKEGYPKRAVLEALQAGNRLPADADLDQLETEWEMGQMTTESLRGVTAPDAAAA